MPEQFSLTGFDSTLKPTDRLFFAIFPDAKAAARIAQHAQHLRGEQGLKGKPLPTDRLHVTLVHLGDYLGVRQDIVDAARKAATALVRAPFDVMFDRVVSFAGRPSNRPFVLRGNDGVSPLMTFQQVLVAQLAKVGLGGAEKSRFNPHVTLLYDDSAVAERSVEPVCWKVREFVLVHSLLGQTRHVPLGRWPLFA